MWGIWRILFGENEEKNNHLSDVIKKNLILSEKWYGTNILLEKLQDQ